jgi:hypothetical protein
VGLERRPLNLVSTIEEQLGRKSSGPGLGIRHDDSVALSIRKRLALTSSTSDGRSDGIVHLRTQANEFS